MMQVKLLARFAALGLASALCFAAADAPGFKVTKKYPVPGDGGFDYVTFDGASNRIYASHGTEVNVLDADTGKVLGKVEDTPGVHGIAIVTDLHRGFTTNGGNATVSVFDTNTFKTIKKISVADDPDFITYDPKTKRVLVCHGDGKVITAIDPDKETVIGKVDLGGGAEAAVVDGKGSGFVNLEEEAEVVHFDPQSLSVKDKWPITGCKTPTGLAIDPANSRLFIACRSKVLAVMDSTNGKVITTLPIGDHTDAAAFDADNQLIFASNGDGTVSVIRQKSPAEYESLGSIKTQRGAKTMAYDPKSKRLFLTTAEMESTAGANGKGGRMRPKPGSFTVLVVERQ
ncbi:MAG TPA: YncE family protein [Bryobacteraceae bacterium]|nr:YncE family protein [Bryobacteraceae bacterium]